MFLDGLDELDRKIVRLLIANARMPYSEIGQQTGISIDIRIARVQSLERRGVIEEYTTVINPQKISGAVSCYFEIETRPDTLSQVIDILMRNETITQIYRVTGKKPLACARGRRLERGNGGAAHGNDRSSAGRFGMYDQFDSVASQGHQRLAPVASVRGMPHAYRF